MSASTECKQCGETNCKLAHDCLGCSGEAVTECDRLHLTCDGCSWQTGAGPEVVVHCLECVACEDEAEDYDEGDGAEGETR